MEKMRFFPRISVDIPSTIHTSSAQREARIINLSFGGALMKCNKYQNSLNSENGPVSLKYFLPQFGYIEHGCNVIRTDNNNVAVDFIDVDGASKVKLWKYIANNLREKESECPACGERFEIMPSVCPSCNWELLFISPEYFHDHDKIDMLKKLSRISIDLDANQIRRLLGFVDIHILHKTVFKRFKEVGKEGTLKHTREVIERQKIKEALKSCNDNISKTAKLLGISRPTLYSYMKKYFL